MSRIADAMFGATKPADPKPILLRIRRRSQDVLREQRALLQDQLDELHDAQGLTLTGVRAALQQPADNIDAALRDLPQQDSPSRVVLLGRTQAGKSTLFRYLTGSEESEIGVGGQRTTTDVLRAPCRFDESVTIADTPGVGAKDGADDMRIALEEARRADLIIWVATTSSLQEQTRFSLDLVASWGIPLILAVNCLEDLTEPEVRRIFLKYSARQPHEVLAAEPGHVARARRTLDAHGQSALCVLPIHAQAAVLGVGPGEDAEALRAASGIQKLQDAILEDVADTAVFRRAVALSDAARLTCSEVGGHLQALTETLGDWTDVSESAMTDLADRAERVMADAALKYAADVRKRLSMLNDWADLHYAEAEKELAKAWTDTSSILEKDLQKQLESGVARLELKLAELSSQVWSSWERTTRQQPPPKGPRFKVSVNPTWLAPAANVGAGAIGLAIGAVVVVGPLGPLVAAPIAAAVLSQVASWLFGGRRRQLRKQRESLNRQMLELRDGYQEQSESAWAEVDFALMARLAEAKDEAQLELATVATHRTLLQRQVDAACRAVQQLDRALCRELLRLQGRPHVADALQGVVRQPGAAAALGMRSDEHLLEVHLRPPRHLDDARFYNGASGQPVERKVAQALALGRSGGRVLRAADGLVVLLCKSMPIVRAERESQLASDVAQCPVRITSRTKESV